MAMTAALRLEFVRATRDRLLYITDTLMHDDRPDVDLAELKKYRQALRDIPNNLRNHENYVSDEESHPYNGSIMNWSYPTKPE